MASTLNFTAKDIILWFRDPTKNNGHDNLNSVLTLTASFYNSKSISSENEFDPMLREVYANISIQSMMENATQTDDIPLSFLSIKFMTMSIHLKEITNKIASSKNFWSRLESLLCHSNEEGLWFLWEQIFILVSSICRMTNFEYLKKMFKSNILRLLLEKEKCFGKFFYWIDLMVLGLLLRCNQNYNILYDYLEQQGLGDFLNLFEPHISHAISHRIQIFGPKVRNHLDFFKQLDLGPRCCATCKKKESKDIKLLHCNACRSIYYCGKKCQKRGWRTHKKNCKKLMTDMV